MLSNKYNVVFADTDVIKNTQRLTNQIWKLIPMRENEEDWKKQLNTVTLELVGLKEIFNPAFLQSLSKLEGLKIEETSFEDYRRTIFETISLLQEFK